MAVRSISLLTVFVWLVCGVSSVANEDSPLLPTLSELLKQPRDPDERRGSPPNEAVQYFVRLHDSPYCEQIFLNREGQRQKRIRHRILVVTWFLKSGACALQYEVDTLGGINSVRHVYNWATQAGETHEISYSQVIDIQALLEKLPPSGNPPPIDRTVHVSFQDHAEWRTGTYDADKLPAAMEAIMHIIGERFETKGDRITPSPVWPEVGPSVVPMWK